MLRLLHYSFSRFMLLHDVANVQNPVFKQCVRWRRKPFWLPVAKSKVFTIIPRGEVPDEERIEISRLRSNYNTYMKSVRVFLRHNVHSTASEEQLVDAGNLEADLVKCKEINDIWNAEVSKIREQRLLHEKESKLKLISQRLEERIQRRNEHIAKIDNLVKKEKEKESQYITPENIDNAIDIALGTEVNYNFAIDTKGNIYDSNTDPAVEEKIQGKLVKTGI